MDIFTLYEKNVRNKRIFLIFAYLFLPRSVEMTWLSTDSWQPKASNREPTLVIYEKDDEKEDIDAYRVVMSYAAYCCLRQTNRIGRCFKKPRFHRQSGVFAQ